MFGCACFSTQACVHVASFRRSLVSVHLVNLLVMQIFAIALASTYAAYILLVRPLGDKVELVYEVLGSLGQLTLLVVIELAYSQKIVVPTEAILVLGFLLVGVKLAKQVRCLLNRCHHRLTVLSCQRLVKLVCDCRSRCCWWTV